MAQGCLKCLKYTMCVANFLCFLCGVSVLGLGIYMTVSFKMAALLPTLASFNVANMLVATGIIIACVSFLGFLGALKENRCLLLTFFLLLFLLMLVELAAACLLLMYEESIADFVIKDLKTGLKDAKEHPKTSTYTAAWDGVQIWLECCGVYNYTDWDGQVPESCCNGTCSTSPKYFKQGCYVKLKDYFEKHFLTTGIAVIVLCVIEVLGMCFAMTLFCHISRSGLGYKL